MQSLNDMFMYKETDVENFLTVKSDTLYPLSQSTTQKKYIFKLESTGYLDANSVLCFKLKSTLSGGRRVNIFNGALGAVRRATLSVGDYVLNDTDSVNKWSTLENFASLSRDVQNGFYSHYFGNSLHTQVVTDVVPDGDQVVNPYGSIDVDNNNSGLSFGGNLSGGSSVGAVDSKVVGINSQPLSTNLDTCVQYGIPLGFLFPALKNKTIPLFLFELYKIYITVYFEEPSQYINSIVQDDYTTDKLQAANNSVSVEDVKLQIDYLIYPSSVVNKQLEMISKEGGYVLDFYDVNHIIKSIPVAENRQKQVVELKIGQENKEVHKLYLLKNMPNASGRRCAGLLSFVCDSMPQETINYNVNGSDLYTVDYDTPGLHYDQLCMALDTNLDVERPMYFMDENSEWAATSGKWSPLQGVYKPLGVDLRNGNSGVIGAGTVIGSYPITCKYSRTPHEGFDQDQDETHEPIHYNSWIHPLNVDIFSMCSRRCVIKSSPKGGQIVAVSY